MGELHHEAGTWFIRISPEQTLKACPTHRGSAIRRPTMPKCDIGGLLLPAVVRAAAGVGPVRGRGASARRLDQDTHYQRWNTGLRKEVGQQARPSELCSGRG